MQHHTARECELGCEPNVCLTAEICSQPSYPAAFCLSLKFPVYYYEIKKKKEERKEEKKEEGRVEGGVSSISIFHVFHKETSVCI